MTFTTSIALTARSASATFAICLRQAQKDTAKTIAFTAHVSQILTSKEAVKTYKMVWNAAIIAGMVAIALGSSAREIMDSYIESCETIPAPVEVPTVEVEEAIAPIYTDVVAPFRRPVKRVSWEAMTPAELRKACAAQGIAWRNFHGQNKHLKKAEMVAALRGAIAA